MDGLENSEQDGQMMVEKRFKCLKITTLYIFGRIDSIYILHLSISDNAEKKKIEN